MNRVLPNSVGRRVIVVLLVTQVFAFTVRGSDALSVNESKPTHVKISADGGVFSADSKHLYIMTHSDAGDRVLLAVLDADSGEKVAEHVMPIDGHFSHDARHLVSQVGEQAPVVWRIDLASKEPFAKQFALKGFEGRVWTVAFSPDGKYIATASQVSGPQQRCVQLWSMKGEKVAAFFGEDSIDQPLAFSSNSRVLVCNCRKAAYAVDVPAMNRIEQFPIDDDAGKYDRVAGARPLDDEHLISWTNESVRIHSIKNGVTTKRVRVPLACNNVFVIDKKRCLASCSSGSYIVDMTDASITKLPDEPKPPLFDGGPAYAISPDGMHFAKLRYSGIAIYSLPAAGK
ncbi:MAG: WD40 repeat domain-containing protein [Pirellulales bacterium]